VTPGHAALTKSLGAAIASLAVTFPLLQAVENARPAGGDVWLELVFGTGLIALGGWSLSNWGALREMKGRFLEAKDAQWERLDRIDAEIREVRILAVQLNGQQDDKRHSMRSEVATKVGDMQLDMLTKMEKLDDRVRDIEINGNSKERRP